LEPAEQWELHDFYGFTENYDDVQALAHRAAVSLARPSLPQQAGKAFRKVAALLARATPLDAGLVPLEIPISMESANGPRRDRNVSVKFLVRAQPDIPAIVRALQALADLEDQIKRDAEDGQDKAA
jgi:hypothetical protein